MKFEPESIKVNSPIRMTEHSQQFSVAITRSASAERRHPVRSHAQAVRDRNAPVTFHHTYDIDLVDRAVAQRLDQIERDIEAKTVDCRPNPYVDWTQGLTEGGGYKITYKDINSSLLIKIGRFTGWCLSMWFVGGVIEQRRLFTKPDDILVAMLVTGVVLYFIWRGPTYVFRAIEICRDCIILDDRDVFWAEFMELGPPMLEWDETREKATISVTYGNRWVELATSHRLDKFDRTPELLQAKLQWAFQQLWYRGQASRKS